MKSPNRVPFAYEGESLYHCGHCDPECGTNLEAYCEHCDTFLCDDCDLAFACTKCGCERLCVNCVTMDDWDLLCPRCLKAEGISDNKPVMVDTQSL